MSLMELPQGDSKTFTLSLRNPNGSPLDLTGLDITFMAKRSRWDSDADAVFTKTVGDGITVADDPTTGVATIAFLPSETSSLTDFRSLRAAVQVQSGDDVKTPWRGKLVVYPDLITTISP